MHAVRVSVQDYSFVCFFFFSSRRRHTRLQGDWSSDVCSSDLGRHARGVEVVARIQRDQHVIGGGPAVQDLGGGEDGAVAQGHHVAGAAHPTEIGRASCRGRGEISVVAVSLKKKKKNICTAVYI